MLLIDLVPCPPFFVPDIYNIFINETKINELNETTVKEIILKCNIQIPTNTTTTATTTLPPITTTSSTTKPTTQSTKVTYTSQSSNETSTGSSSTSNTTSVTQTSSKPSTGTQLHTVTTTKGQSTTRPTTTLSTAYSNSTIYSASITPDSSTNKNATLVPGATGCTGVCLIGIVTGAICLCILLLLIIGLSVLCRRGRGSKRLPQSQSRHRYGDLPDVHLYDGVVEDVAYNKRYSAISFVRRSGDFSKSGLLFDNPAYSSRSLENRPSRLSRNSWYDPDADKFEYSQMNANLVFGTSRSPENRRAVSESRLHDYEIYNGRDGRRRERSYSMNNTIYNYVPKNFTEVDSGFESSYRRGNGHIPNGTFVDHRYSHTSPSKEWYTHRSTGSLPVENGFLLADSNYSRNKEKNTGIRAKAKHRGRRNKHKRERNKVREQGIFRDRFYRSGSAGRDNDFRFESSYRPDNRDTRSDVQATLRPEIYMFYDPSARQRHERSNKDSAWNNSLYFDEYPPPQNKKLPMYTTKL